MRIEEAFEVYSSKVAEVHIYRQAIRRAADQEVRRLHEQREKQQESGFSDSLKVSGQNMSFRTAETGAFHFYAFHDATIQELIDSLVKRTNRQYQWLLADTYELFEDYLEHAYACMGYSDNGAWPLRDYGGTCLPELGTKNYDYFLQQSQNKRERPYSIINQFRLKLPLIKRWELTNSLDTNLCLAIAVIEKMRHFIVHLRGEVNNKTKATKEILERAAVYNNGNPSEANLSFVSSYLRLTEEDGCICLMDIPAESIGHFDVFESLSNHLLAYAFTIRNALSKK